MNPALGRSPANPIEVRLAGGLKLPGRVWPCESPRALIAIVHGLGEHSGRYAALASDLVQARFTVAALDLPGHGEAPGARGDAPSWTLLREQVVPATLTASHGLPGQPDVLPAVLLATASVARSRSTTRSPTRSAWPRSWRRRPRCAP